MLKLQLLAFSHYTLWTFFSKNLMLKFLAFTILLLYGLQWPADNAIVNKNRIPLLGTPAWRPCALLVTPQWTHLADEMFLLHVPRNVSDRLSRAFQESDQSSFPIASRSLFLFPWDFAWTCCSPLLPIRDGEALHGVLHTKPSREFLQKQPLHPGGHRMVRWRRSVVNINDEHRDNDWQGNKNHNKEEVLANEGDDFGRRRDDLFNY